MYYFIVVIGQLMTFSKKYPASYFVLFFFSLLKSTEKCPYTICMAEKTGCCCFFRFNKDKNTRCGYKTKMLDSKPDRCQKTLHSRLTCSFYRLVNGSSSERRITSKHCVNSTGSLRFGFWFLFFFYFPTLISAFQDEGADV